MNIILLIINIFALNVFAQSFKPIDESKIVTYLQQIENHSNEIGRTKRQAVDPTGGAAGGVAPVFNILGQTLGSALAGGFQGIFGRPNFGQGNAPGFFGQGIAPGGFSQGNIPGGFGQGNVPGPAQQGFFNPFQNFFQSIPGTFASANFRPTNNMGNLNNQGTNGFTSTSTGFFNPANNPGSNGFVSSTLGNNGYTQSPGNNGFSPASGNNGFSSASGNNGFSSSSSSNNVVSTTSSYSDIYDPANDPISNVVPQSDSVNPNSNLFNPGPVTFNRPNVNPTTSNSHYASNFGSYFPGSSMANRRRYQTYPAYYTRLRYN